MIRVAALAALPVLVLLTPGGWPSAVAVVTGYAVTLVWYALAFRRRRRAYSAQPGPERSDYVRPQSLPPAPPYLFGRERDLAALRAALQGEPPRYGPRVIAVHGPAGIGKTALVVSFAHLVAEQYPDGQLFGRLGDDTDPVLASFIRALTKSEDTVAAGGARRYRELTEGRRVLVVLDDVPSVDVARRLLPAGTHCLVLVTSREPLPGLDSVLDLELGALDADSALETLRALIGSRISLTEGSETGAAQRIVDATWREPLALQLAGNLLAERPQWSLRPVIRMLEADTVHDAGWSRRPLDMAYLLLTGEEQRAVRLLGLFADEPVTPWKLSALLTDTNEEAAGRILERLVLAGMVERIDRDVAGVAEYRVLEDVQEYALERLRRDRHAHIPNLRAALDAVRTRGVPALSTMDDPLVLLEQGRISAALTVARAAVAAARTGADPRAESHALSCLAEVQLEIGGVQAAAELARSALERAGGDPVAQARALRCESRVQRGWQDVRGALAKADRALRLLDEARADGQDARAERIRALRHRATTYARLGRSEAARDDLSTAEALVHEYGAGLRPPARAALALARGVVWWHAGEYEPALRHLRRAQELAVADRQPLWHGWAVLHQARAERALGHLDEALAQARRSLDLFGDMAHRYGKAYARLEIADVYRDQHDLDAASVALETALETLRTCGDRWIEADAMRRLAAVWSAQDSRLYEVAALLRGAARLFHGVGDLSSADTVTGQRRLVQLRRLLILPTTLVPQPR